MKTRWNHWLAIVALTLAACGVVQAKPKPVATQPAAAHVAPVPLLWKVTASSGAQLYLLGSFHLLKPSDYPLSSDVDTAFSAADRLLFELGPEEVNSPALPALMMKAALRTDGRKLQDDLDAKTWAALEAYATRNAMPLDRLAGLKPWFVGLTISLSELSKQGLDPELGLDRKLMQRATAAGKAMAGLETAASQIAALDGMDTVEQGQLLAEALEQGEKGEALSRRMHEAWRRGDKDLLWNDMAAPLRTSYPQLYQRINVDRNNAWLPLLEQHLAGSAGRTLAVVGALHLLGPDGVVEKLRARGYAVERICSACPPVKKTRR
jgi:uncharacterized protein YbaP (TraB family)